jgi:hypothetical protein
LKKRKPKKTDQEKTNEAFNLLLETMQKNDHIESSLWAGATWSCIVNGYINSDCPYEEFCEELERIKKHYEKWWEK